MTWADLGEIIKALGSVFTAATAFFGVYIAYRGLERWRAETIGKRRAEIAEETLTNFYQAREIIQSARAHGGYSQEASARKREDWETDDETRLLNRYFFVLDRLERQQQFFSQMFSSSFRFIAIFGPEAGQPYNDLFMLRKEIATAARMLLIHYRNQDNLNIAFIATMIVGDPRPVPLPPEKAPPQREGLPVDRPGLEARIWVNYTARSDPIQVELDSIVASIERTCRPAIQESVRR